MSTSASHQPALTAVHIPCCLCGAMILPNNANQCGTCLAQQFDLKATLMKGIANVHQCRKCRRYARLGDTIWEHCEPESPQLLSLCLKHVPALNNANSKHNGFHVVDAIWVWTVSILCHKIDCMSFGLA